MYSHRDLNRLIITNKGLDISKDIKRELQSTNFKDISQYDTNTSKTTRYNENIPYGYKGQLQARQSIQVINKPIKSRFLIQDVNLKGINNNSSMNLNGLKGIGDSFIQGADNNVQQQISDRAMRTSFLKTKSGEGSSTFYVVRNNSKLKNQINADCLGGFKLNIHNQSYQNEVNNQNLQQKQQMEQVQSERLISKYNEWNEQYMKSNEMMKTKYYQKYENITKLINKDNEQQFWKNWNDLKQTVQETISSTEQENMRYEERIARKLTKKYKKSFQTLPHCALKKEIKPKIEALPKVGYFKQQ